MHHLRARARTPVSTKLTTAGLVAVLVFYAGVASLFFVLGHGLDALASGLFSAMGAGFLAASLTAPRIGRRLGATR